MAGKRTVREEWECWPGTLRGFARDLDRRGVPYLSFSKVASLESCEQRFYLEYVKRVRVFPRPAWAVKGQVFHEAAARVLRALGKGRKPRLGAIRALIEREVDIDARHHLANAVEVLLGNGFEGWEIVAVEAPFVFDPGEEIPTVLGIIDLVLRKDRTFAVVDHKTCSKFGSPDPLQLILYREYVRRSYGASRCIAWFDEYRWVNSLDRVRIPATRRTEVRAGRNAWRDAKRRLSRSHREMERIRATGEAAGGGGCHPCPFKTLCPKADLGRPGWWY